MSPIAWLRARKGLASGVVLSLMAVGGVTVAVVHRGFPVTDPDLRAREVWVTNGEELLAGRLNRQIEELDASVATQSNGADVLQDGADVFLYDRDAGSIERIDPAFTTLTQRVEVPIGSRVAFGGDMLAVLSPRGELWAIPAGGELSFDAAGTKPVIEVGADAEVAVGADGTTFVTEPGAHVLHRLAPDGAAPLTTDLPEFGAHQLAAVGDRAVVLDTDRDVLLVEGREIELPGEALRLQQSGPEHDTAYVAGADALLAVPLDGGSVREIDLDAAGSEPARSADEVAAPVFVEGCVHAARATSSSYVVQCRDAEPVRSRIVPSTVGARLEFRVNRDVVALNDLNSGNTWLVDANLRLVDNWEEVTPPEESDELEGDEKSAQQVFEDTLAERTETNRPPTARDDELGVRPDRTTLLEVLENDTDPDGDVLTIKSVSDVAASLGRLETIDDGRALQFTPADGAAGTVSFRYSVEDGRSGAAEAAVNVRIVPVGENAAPAASREAAVAVEQGQQISYNVLSDWTDPDGDDVFLVNASPTGGDTVRFSPDGFVTFEHRSGELGLKEVAYTVSDGQTSASGTLTVDVQAVGALNPVGTPDFGQGFAGETVLVEPLLNDLSPSGAPLALLGIDEIPDGLTATPDLERGTIAFSSPEPGDFTVLYDLGAGSSVSVGLIRVRIVDQPEADPPPIAVVDIAYLRPGEPTTVSVLANDVSPSGRVLAVQSVDSAEIDDLVSVEVLTNTALRITAAEALDRQLQLRYTVSDGSGSSSATVTVVPVPPLVKHQPPVAVDDAAKVRAGDIATVDVLGNDYHPDAAAMRVLPELASTELGDGVAFVDRSRVRFQAPEEPGTYTAVYSVVDDFEQTARASIAFTVVARDDEGNTGPALPPLTSRTFAGSAVTVDIPLDGLDPDGDSLVLTGVLGGAALGRVVDQTSTSITYEAFEGSSGTDTITYEVHDALGERATGSIRIGVIPPPETSAPPNAVDDTIEMKPGRRASVEVLLNDSDPSGRALGVVDLPQVDDALEAEIDDRRRVIVTAPEHEGAFTLRYEVSNGHGGADTAFVQVVVKHDATVLPPTAADQVVEPVDVVGVDTVRVDPLRDATNPGGLVDELVVRLEGPNAGRATVLDDGTVEVRPSSRRFAVAFRLTNELDELDAMAFIVVPAAGEDAADPYLADLDRIVVPMNGRISWQVSDIVVAPSGRPVRSLSATSTNWAESSFVDEQTLQYVPKRDYRGEASVTFEVSDRADAKSGDPRNVFLTIPVFVGDPEFADTPPVFTPRSETIEAGEAPLAIDLRASTDHPNPAMLERVGYANLRGTTPEIEATVAGGILTVSAPLGVPTGTATRLTFDVVLGEFTVPGYVDVTVVSSTRAKPQALDDGPFEMVRSDSQTLDVLANDVNPFPGTALQVVAAEIDQTDVGSSASVTHTSTGITVQTGASFTGTLSVIYRIQDATKDPTRQTQGRVMVTVRDRPEVPKAPVIVSEQNGSVSVRWSAPPDNNSAISGYRLSWNGGSADFAADAAGLAHTISGLANGTAYRFQVEATNGIGTSGASPTSASGTPFGLPGAPAGANLVASASGDARLSLNWSPPANDGGRGISRYEWTFEGTPGGSGTATGTSASATGSNGSGSRYFVQACNVAGCGPRTMSGTVTPTAPWTPVNGTTVTQSTCPEPDETYTNPPTNAERGCTMNPAGMIPAGTVIDAVCRSQRWGESYFYMVQASGVYNGWFVLAAHTNRGARTVPDC
ncbi:Ig-like domain-containing protein [Agromyces cerinus]|uniref:Fibronectin type III domain-containing protein n=1 Tax=Agromyces cerinus subsp. cerinus TaxID=232089 RepID=A0A1N6DL11_9MICO|nr:Ig-like domain-containing protein [Agromyces cerinus]SIN71475.1 Fibronectin type III domain-containing protein [Agromyces cerinus subsp. cerinus]